MTGALVSTSRQVVGGAAPQTVDVAQLTGSQKAAIILQMILSEGGKVDLSGLDDTSQMRIATDYASLVRVTQATMQAVVEEFEGSLGRGDLAFPAETEAALDQIESLLSPEVSPKLRDRFGMGPDVDPWRGMTELEPKDLADRLVVESPQIGAVILSKLNPDKAGEVLEFLPEDRAIAVTLAIAQTHVTPPEPVQRIGTSMASRDQDAAPQAFAKDPIARTAAILNAATASQRDALLEQMAAKDKGFAKAVRKAIFTFADIAERVTETDVPKFTRDVPQEALVTALVAASDAHGDVVNFILDNMSQRMADQLRDEMSDLGEVAPKPGEAAMGQVTAVIRALIDRGEMTMKVVDGDEDE